MFQIRKIIANAMTETRMKTKLYALMSPVFSLMTNVSRPLPVTGLKPVAEVRNRARTIEASINTNAASRIRFSLTYVFILKKLWGLFKYKCMWWFLGSIIYVLYIND